MWLSQWAYLDACPLISSVVILPRSLASFRWVHTLLTCIPPHCGLVFSASADLVTGKSDPLFDPHMFRFGRFEEGDEVRGQYEYSIVG
jgi:hypothetical protein